MGLSGFRHGRIIFGLRNGKIKKMGDFKVCVDVAVDDYALIFVLDCLHLAEVAIGSMTPNCYTISNSRSDNC